MWTIVKFKKKELNIFLKILKKKLSGNIEYYLPKAKKTERKNSKFIEKTFYILNDYAFIYHKNFSNPKTINYLNNSKGVIYFLSNYLYCQNEIVKFINHCKNNEDDKGFINKSLNEIIKEKYYKFKSGPFESMIFQLLEKRKKELKIKLGKFDNLLIKNNYNFEPV